MTLGLNREPWVADAACANTDPDVFFPIATRSPGADRDAKRICAGCSVQDACGQYAADHGEQWGVWGGLSESDRHKSRRAAA